MAEEQPGTLGHSVSIAHGSTSPISIEPSQGMRNGRYRTGASDEREKRLLIVVSRIFFLSFGEKNPWGLVRGVSTMC